MLQQSDCVSHEAHGAEVLVHPNPRVPYRLTTVSEAAPVAVHAVSAQDVMISTARVLNLAVGRREQLLVIQPCLRDPT